VLSDDELQALREIERRLRWESPELVQLFNSQEPRPAKNHRQRARTRVLLAAAAITGLVQLGPRMLTEAEVRTQQRVPLPRTASPPGRSCFRSRRGDRPDRGRRHLRGAVTDCDDTALSSGLTFHQNWSPSSPTSTTTERRAELERK
jgi:hypothetical protein